MVKNSSTRHLIVPISPTGLLGLKKVWMPYRDVQLPFRGDPLLECFTMDDFSGAMIPKLEYIGSITYEEAEVTFEIYILTHIITNPPHVEWIERKQYQHVLGYTCIDVFSVSTLYFIIGHLEDRRKSVAMRN